ncbi:hypothetical protein [Erythrobacter mangrovi]|uniref:Uncharacterized protein n=1 Tax=Erythrobacter mangrovi TaxID=2739433 RepID=A0A7D3XCK7_9SPHN|nr:hypothetical protein [Erythrobacter mangrovi]QKG71880.1 hypothetical protein HQR01_11215 [Erythrobacter mangrovi]
MPGIIERMKSVEGLIKAIAALLALLPAFALLKGVVNIPPDVDDLITFISAAVGLVVVVVVLLATRWIDATRNRWVGLGALLAVIVGAGTAVAYFDYAGDHIVVIPAMDEEDSERIVIPDAPSDELQALVRPYGGDYVEAMQLHVRRDRIRQLVESENTGATVRIIVLLVLAQILVTGGLVLGLWKLAGAMRKDEGVAAADASVPSPSPPADPAMPPGG